MRKHRRQGSASEINLLDYFEVTSPKMKQQGDKELPGKPDHIYQHGANYLINLLHN